MRKPTLYEKFVLLACITLAITAIAINKPGLGVFALIAFALGLLVDWPALASRKTDPRWMTFKQAVEKVREIEKTSGRKMDPRDFNEMVLSILEKEKESCTEDQSQSQ